MGANGIILPHNIRPVRKIFDEFVVMVSALNVKPSVINVTEHGSMTTATHCFEIHAYQKLIACNREAKGGGVAIYIQKILKGMKCLATKPIC